MSKNSHIRSIKILENLCAGIEYSDVHVNFLFYFLNILKYTINSYAPRAKLDFPKY
jgi:hypothetical protein